MIALLLLAAAAVLTTVAAGLVFVPAGLFVAGCWCGLTAWLLSD